MNKLADQKKIISLLEPFDKPTFGTEAWEDIKQAILTHNLAMHQDKSTVEEFQYFLRLLLDLNECSDYNQYFGDSSIKDFFFGQIFPPVIKKVLLGEYPENSEILSTLNEIIRQMLLFWIKACYDDHSRLQKMARSILDPSKKYYNNSKSSGKVNPQLEPVADHLSWLSGLRKGDVIDCIKFDSYFNQISWSHAQIQEIEDSCIIKVSFLNDEKNVKEFNKKLNAHEIAPYKSRCHDFEWRTNLKEGDKLYAYKKKRGWLPAVVLKTQEDVVGEGRHDKKVKIGFRVYSADGRMMTLNGNKYEACSAKFDEWFNVTEPRLSKEDMILEKSTSYRSIVSCYDADDIKICEPKGKKLYALMRSNYCQSEFFVQLVNTFGEKGGFDIIYQRISDTKNWAPIQTVSSLCYILGKLSPLLHREFAIEYIPKLQDAVWRNLLDSPKWNIKNFSKHKINQIINAFASLLSRIHSSSKVQDMIDALHLQICNLCQGSEHLFHIISTLSGFITREKIAKKNKLPEWIRLRLNHILDQNKTFFLSLELLGNQILLRKSDNILRYMIKQNLINFESFESLCKIISNGNKEAKKIIYKAFSSILSNLQNEHLEYLVSQISKVPTSEIMEEDINFMIVLNQVLKESPSMSKNFYEFYWKIISDTKEKHSQRIIKLIISSFCETLKQIDQSEEEINVLNGCLDNIHKGVSVLASLKIISFILNRRGKQIKVRGKACIDYLCQEKGLLNLIIDNTKAFKANILEKIKIDSVPSEQDLDLIIDDGYSYKEHITIRIQILRYITTYSSPKDKRFNYRILCNVWDFFIVNSLILDEKVLAYELLASITRLFRLPIDIKDLKEFFRNKMDPKVLLENECATKSSFNFFKNVFREVNKLQDKISESTESSFFFGAPRSFTNALPNKIEGIETLWEYVWTSTSNYAGEQATTLLTDLYSNLHDSLLPQKLDIQQEYITICNHHLQETLKNYQNYSDTVFSMRCLRYIKLINNMLDASEEQANQRLQVHFVPKNTEVLTIRIENSVNIAPGIPREIELHLTSTSTYLDLLVEVGRAFKVSWKQVNLTIGIDLFEPDMIDAKNGTSLKDINISSGSTLRAIRKSFTDAQNKSLLQDDKNMNPLLRDILIELFHKDTENEKMSPEDCARFIHSCSADNCQANDRRVQDVFDKYDDDKDGYLTLENFLDFYLLASIRRPSVVWSNLYAHQYTNEFEKFGSTKISKVDVTPLLRFIIGASESYFQKIYSLLDYKDEIAVEALKLIYRLPTSPHKVLEIVNFEINGRSFDELLDVKSKYSLLYSLQIMEILTINANIDDQRIKQIENILLSYDSSILQKIKKWRADLISKGGLKNLIKHIETFSNNFLNETTPINSDILYFGFQILKNGLLEVNKTFELPPGKLLSKCVDFMLESINDYHNYDSLDLFDLSIKQKEQFKALSEEMQQESNPKPTSIDNIKDFLDTTLTLLIRGLCD